MPTWTKVATRGELADGTGKVADIGGKAVAVFSCGGTIYAVDNICPHRGGPLGEGSLSGTTVTCPWHGWEFDVATGRCAMNPAVTQATYPVKLEGDDILIGV